MARQRAKPKRPGRRQVGGGSPKRVGRSDWSLGPITYGPPLGEGVAQAPLAEVLAAIEATDSLDWESAAARLLPVLPRLRAYPPGSPAPLIAMLPPGVATGFGIDIGPAVLNVSPELAASWDIGLADLAARAVANVHERAEVVDASAIVFGNMDGAPTAWLQTGGSIGSTLIFAPHHLRRLFGAEHRIFITPMRDLIIGLPGDADPELALWLHAEIAAEDPNCLGPTGYAFDGTRVTPIQLDLGHGFPLGERPVPIA